MKPRAGRKRLAALTCLLALPGAALHAASPQLSSIVPRGAPRGGETVLALNGARLADAREALLYYPGVTVTKLEAVNENQVKVTVAVAGDCRLGEHALRLRTATGISDLRTFYVGALPEVDEVEPNGDFAAPQKIALNVTVRGVVQSEDVDYFAVDAKKGQRLTADVEGMRLATTVFDPYVAILNQARFELAAADDAAAAWQDAIASVLVPEDGTYIILVRESAYGGDGNCMYRLHAGTFPRPAAALPGGGKFGEEVEVTFLGDAAGESRRTFRLPASPPPLFGLFAEDQGGIAPAPVPFRLSPYGNVIEAEPNDAFDKATPAEIPVAMNGVISRPGDADFFRFTARKGQTFDVHLHGRRLRSPLDSVMVIHHMNGAAIAANDDAVGPDSYFRFTAPEDKEYAISVTDHLRKGGPEYAYRLEFAPVEPRLSLGIPMAVQFSQERQAVAVPRGNRYAALVSVSRADFGGDVVLSAEGLPPGVAMTTEPIGASVDQVPVVFEAAAEAPVAGALAALAGRHADPSQKIEGGFRQAVELVYGPPNQSVYWRHEVNRLAVAVTEEAPFRIQVVEPKAPLVHNGSMNLKVIAERKEGFKAPIALQMVYNPPGVGSAGGVAIPEGASEAFIPINANSGAPARAWKIAVAGVATVGNGPVWVSSQLATLRIAPPYLTFQMEKASVEQGKSAEIFCKVTHNAPFDGAARVDLVGLPAKVTAPAVEVTKDTKEFAFKVAVDPASPAGQHKNIFCQAVVIESGEPVLHALGGTELRIDVPIQPQAEAPAAPKEEKKPEAPAAPPAKRLTRLEKLRLEAEERVKGAPR